MAAPEWDPFPRSLGAASVTTPADPGFLPDLGHDLDEAGKTAGAGRGNFEGRARIHVPASKRGRGVRCR